MGSPSVLDKPIEIQAWLNSAARGNCLLLSTDASAASLSLPTLALKTLEERLKGSNNTPPTVLRGEMPAGSTFPLSCAYASEHERGWLAVANLHEKVLGVLKEAPSIDYIFCLDPWAASLKSNLAQNASQAKWVWVSDNESLQSESEREYWHDLNEWLFSQKFEEVIAARSLITLLSKEQWKPSQSNELPSYLKQTIGNKKVLVLDQRFGTPSPIDKIKETIRASNGEKCIVLVSPYLMECQKQNPDLLSNCALTLKPSDLTVVVYGTILQAADEYIAPSGLPFGAGPLSLLRDGTEVLVPKGEFDTLSEQDQKRLVWKDRSTTARALSVDTGMSRPSEPPAQFSKWWRDLGQLQPSASKRGVREISILTCCFKYLQRFRMFLDSIVRQNYPLDRIEICVALPGNPDGVLEHIALLQRIHPLLSIVPVNVPETMRKNRGKQINAAFHASSAQVVMASDCDLVLPKNFVQRILKEHQPEFVLGCWRTPLSAEVTAHIITGNLDAVEHFDTLSQQWDPEEKVGCRQGVLGYCQVVARDAYKTVLYPEEFDQINQSDIVFIERIQQKLGISPRMLEDLFVLHLAHPRNWNGTEVFL